MDFGMITPKIKIFEGSIEDFKEIMKYGILSKFEEMTEPDTEKAEALLNKYGLASEERYDKMDIYAIVCNELNELKQDFEREK